MTRDVDFFQLDLHLSNGDWFVDCFDSFEQVLDWLSNKYLQYSDFPFACQLYVTTIFKDEVNDNG